jgi:hypothetical protein
VSRSLSRPRRIGYRMTDTARAAQEDVASHAEGWANRRVFAVRGPMLEKVVLPSASYDSSSQICRWNANTPSKKCTSAASEKRPRDSKRVARSTSRSASSMYSSCSSMVSNKGVAFLRPLSIAYDRDTSHRSLWSTRGDIIDLGDVEQSVRELGIDFVGLHDPDRLVEVGSLQCHQCCHRES